MRLRTRLVGLVATLSILGIVVGLPVALLAIGANPLPDELPSLEQLRVFLTSPDDGTLALGFITLVGWAAWAFLAASLVLEGLARLRRTAAPRLPGLALPQTAARGLIGAALLLFVAAPGGMQTAHASTATAAIESVAASTTSTATSVPSEQAERSIKPPAHAAPPEGKSPTVEHTVSRGDTLWSLAETHLGDGSRYSEIVELNPKALGDDPGFLTPGTVLIVPTTSTEGVDRAGTKIVERGDTLSGIAAEELGDPDRYPEIYAASKDTEQPGNRYLADPDLILPGWSLTIPETDASTKTHAAPTPKTPSGSVAPSSSNAIPHSVPSSEKAEAETERPKATATPSIPSGQGQSSGATTSAADASTSDTAEAPSVAPWMLAGLVGGGGVLAGSMALLLLRRRRSQFRARRPGRTIATPEPVLVPVEKTVTAIGSTTAPTVEHLDAALRQLAAAHAGTGQSMPEVAAVQMTQTGLTLHLSDPSALEAPWQGTEDHLHWTLPAPADPEAVGQLGEDQPAPYPMLCTIGASDAGDVWMLNLEDMDLVITGDIDYGRDFARYIAAEIACNPWSHGVTVDLIGVATEVAAMNPERVRVHTGADPAADLVADAVAMIDRSLDAGTDVSTARAAQLGADPWPARMLMVDAAAETTPAMEQLLELVRSHAGQTGTSVVVRGKELAADGIEVQISASGRIVMPTSGLDLIAVGLTGDEAQGCAALLAQSEDLEDVDIPSLDDAEEEGWKAWTDEAGALRDEYTLPRVSLDDEEGDHTEVPPTSILADPDEEYIEHAATTVDDLNVLAPRVTPRVREAVLNADPTLDDDVELWHSETCALPRLTFLGPVTARTRGMALAKRKPYFTELLAYLVTRRHGATPDEVADTFNISQTKARDYVNTVRDWLGTNPRTGDKHLPDARKAPLAQTRGTSVYQVLDVLVDADLFRRLRARGEARGAEGIDDLCAALRLVQGRPFDNLRKGGWYWLSEGDRLDQHMVCAVVDVAHLVTTHSLRVGDLKRARLAAETAALAAPDEEIPRLDLAAVAAAEGHANEADRILRDEILNRTDDDGPPAELSERTQQIISGKDWLKQSQRAS